MPLSLPTDTTHLRPASRQYEVFGRPLGRGIERRTIAVGAAVLAIWWPLLGVLGVWPFGRFGPLAYLVPVAVVTVLGARTGEDGRMSLLRVWDVIASWHPARRRVLRNPALATQRPRAARPLRVTARTVVRPGPDLTEPPAAPAGPAAQTNPPTEESTSCAG